MLLLVRTKWLTVGELLVPALIMLVFGTLDSALKFSPPAPTTEAFVTLKDSSGPLQCKVFDNEDGRYGYRMPIPGAWCVPLVFAPSTSADVRALLETVATRNGFDAPTYFYDADDAVLTSPDTYPAACGSTSGKCLLGFETTDQLKEWIKVNGGRAGAAVAFGDTYERTDVEGNDYVEQVRATARKGGPTRARADQPGRARVVPCCCACARLAERAA